MVPRLDLRARLAAQLSSAMRRRETRETRVLRTILARIANAEAVSLDDVPSAGALELSAQGVGAAEVPRRVLRDQDVRRIAWAEIDEIEAAARLYDDGGQPQQADDLRHDADVLRDILRRDAGRESESWA